MRKKNSKVIRIILSAFLVGESILSSFQYDEASAALITPSKIEYKKDINLITDIGLEAEAITGAGDSSKGIYLYSLNGSEISSGTLKFLGNDAAGLKSYRAAYNGVTPDVEWKELRNLVFNLPPFKSKSTLQELTGQTSIPASETLIQYYMTNDSDSYSGISGSIINTLKSLDVTTSSLEVTMSNFDKTTAAHITKEYAYYGPFSFTTSTNSVDDELYVNTDNSAVSLVNNSYEETATVGTSSTYYIRTKRYNKVEKVNLTLTGLVAQEHISFHDNALLPYCTLETMGTTLEIGNLGKSGNIKLELTDHDNGQAISGVNFTAIHEDDDSLSYNGTTDSSGTITFSNVAEGTYTVKQTSLAEGYNSMASDKTASITADGAIVSLLFTNSKFVAPVTIKVQDNSATGLSGAVLSITDTNGNTVATGETNKDGFYTTVLPAGAYIVSQTQLPVGYKVLGSESQSFTINSESDNVKLNFTNEAFTGSVSVSFYDEDNASYLSSGSFSIKASDGKIIGTYDMRTTNVTVPSLTAGTYTLVMVTAPEDYSLNSSEYTFSITQDGESASVQVICSKSLAICSIQLVDESGKAFSDTNIELTDTHDSSKVYTLVTDSSGSAYSGSVELGTYSVKIIDMPLGYTMDKEYTVTLTTEGETVNQVIILTQIKATLIVQKLFAGTKDGVSDAVFSVEAEDGKVNIVTTDDTGAAVLELAYGKYTVSELEGGTGATAATEPVKHITIESEKPVTVTFETDIETGIIMLENYNTLGYDNKISGVKYTLFNSDNTVFKSLTTNDIGVVLFEDVPLGKYTLQQVSVPEGYVLYDKLVTINVDKADNVVAYNAISAVNVGSITLTYTDSKTKNGIAHAGFSVYTSEGELVDTMYTDNNGKALFTQLPIGTYFAKMISAPTGYNLITDQIGDGYSLVGTIGNGTNMETSYNSMNFFSNISVRAATNRFVISASNLNLAAGGNVTASVDNQHGESSIVLASDSTDGYDTSLLGSTNYGSVNIDSISTVISEIPTKEERADDVEEAKTTEDSIADSDITGTIYTISADNTSNGDSHFSNVSTLVNTTSVTLPKTGQILSVKPNLITLACIMLLVTLWAVPFIYKQNSE